MNNFWSSSNYSGELISAFQLQHLHYSLLSLYFQLHEPIAESNREMNISMRLIPAQHVANLAQNAQMQSAKWGLYDRSPGWYLAIVTWCAQLEVCVFWKLYHCIIEFYENNFSVNFFLFSADLFQFEHHNCRGHLFFLKI